MRDGRRNYDGIRSLFACKSQISQLQIGRTFVEMVKQKYTDYLRIAVIAYNDELHFYENCGFKKADSGYEITWRAPSGAIPFL